MAILTDKGALRMLDDKLANFLIARTDIQTYTQMDKVICRGQLTPKNHRTKQQELCTFSCPCTTNKEAKDGSTIVNEASSTFPIKNIFAPHHEFAHWYISRVLPRMVENGDLVLPDFISQGDYEWAEPSNSICPGSEGSYENSGKAHAFIWNSMRQDSKIEDQCKLHHYFISAGQHYIGLEGNGEMLENGRRIAKSRSLNIYKMYKILFPCDNPYVSICEDFAYGMTKGLAQKLIIGQSKEGSPSEMVCRSDVDKPELTEIRAIKSVPQNDFVQDKKWFVDKCKRVLRTGGWITGSKLGDLKQGEVERALEDGNEYAWWLRYVNYK